MICEFPFCIYNQDNQCALDEISINAYGVCDDAIYFNISEYELSDYKKRTLEKYDSYSVE